MNILYLGYWGAREGLTEATIYPHLEVLAQFEFIQSIYFLSIEREGKVEPLDLKINKVRHIPLVSEKSSSVLINKIDDFIRFPKEICEMVRNLKIELLICRSAPAGILGYLVHKKVNLPFWVESFEPHAAYMLEAGVWKKWDPKYLIQLIGEKLQYENAECLFPVSEGYKQALSQKSGREDLIVLPCTVDVEKFRWSSSNRESIRKQFGISDEVTCGIYVGKFGGLYYDKEAFEIFKEAKRVFNNFFLIILTPQPADEVKQKLKGIGMEDKAFFIKSVSHEEVPPYMHAADFAFAPIKPIQSQKYSSPIKTAEYWAAGLPFLLSEGVGDESDIITGGNGGILFNLHNIKGALERMQLLLKNEIVKSSYLELAEKYRGRFLVRKAYQQAFMKLAN